MIVFEQYWFFLKIHHYFLSENSIIKLISSGIQLKTKIAFSSCVNLKLLNGLKRLIHMIWLYLSSISFVRSSSLFCTRKQWYKLYKGSLFCFIWWICAYTNGISEESLPNELRNVDNSDIHLRAPKCSRCTLTWCSMSIMISIQGSQI